MYLSKYGFVSSVSVIESDLRIFSLWNVTKLVRDDWKPSLETDLILADEPTGNLDFQTSKEIFSLFLKLKKLKKTIIFATHNRELANRADYKLFISNGDIKRVNAR